MDEWELEFLDGVKKLSIFSNTNQFVAIFGENKIEKRKKSDFVLLDTVLENVIATQKTIEEKSSWSTRVSELPAVAVVYLIVYSWWSHFTKLSGNMSTDCIVICIVFRSIIEDKIRRFLYRSMRDVTRTQEF